MLCKYQVVVCIHHGEYNYVSMFWLKNNSVAYVTSTSSNKTHDRIEGFGNNMSENDEELEKIMEKATKNG